MSEARIPKERMLMQMLRYHERQPGEHGYRLARRVRHQAGFGGWSALELDDLYQEMIRLPFLRDHVSKEEEAP
jgi:hypothetical protein